MVVFPEKFYQKLGNPSNSTEHFPLPLSRFLYSKLSLKSLLEREEHLWGYSSPFTFIVAVEGAKDELKCYLAICEVSTSLWSSVGILGKYFFRDLAVNLGFLALLFVS